LLSNDVVAERKTSAKNKIRIVMAKRLYNVMSRKQEKQKLKKLAKHFFCVSKSIFFLAGAKREKKIRNIC
jgi:hypothetical protein